MSYAYAPNTRRALAAVAALSAAMPYCMGLVRPSTRPDQSVEDRRMDKLPEVSARLLGPISDVCGHEWARGPDGKPLNSTAVDRPHEALIRLPDGRPVRLESKLTFLVQDEDHAIVEFVEVVPNVRLLRLQAAVSEMEAAPEAVGCRTNRRYQAAGRGMEKRRRPQAGRHRRHVGYCDLPPRAPC